jgi:hypothetical protein
MLWRVIWDTGEIIAENFSCREDAAYWGNYNLPWSAPWIVESYESE